MTRLSVHQIRPSLKRSSNVADAWVLCNIKDMASTQYPYEMKNQFLSSNVSRTFKTLPYNCADQKMGDINNSALGYYDKRGQGRCGEG